MDSSKLIGSRYRRDIRRSAAGAALPAASIGEPLG